MRIPLPNWQFRRSIKLVSIILGIVGIIGFTGKKHSERTCQKINVEILNDDLNHFVDENDVVILLGDTTINPVTGKPLGQLNTRLLEQRLKKNCPYIEDVQVSYSLGGDLLVRLKQVRPIARLVRNLGRDYYLCANEAMVPVSNKFTARVLVIDGATTQLLKQDSVSLERFQEAYRLVTQISANDLLSKLIVQATVDNNGEYILYPQISRQQIMLGRPDNLENKLARLEAFYNKIIPAKGWDTYQKVSLKFDNQIVCE